MKPIEYISIENMGLIKFNPDTKEIKNVKSSYPNIDRIFIIDEDGTFDGKPVKVNDMIFMVHYSEYTGRSSEEYLIVNHQGFLKSLQKYIKENNMYMELINKQSNVKDNDNEE